MIIPVFLDRPAPCSSEASRPVSVLTLPLGKQTILDSLCASARAVDDAPPIIVPTFETNGTYESAILAAASTEVRIARPDEWSKLYTEWEPTDWLAVVDVARWPATNIDLRGMIGRHQDYHGATHMVAVGRDPERTREQLDIDDEGCIERVRRVYVGKSWPEAISRGLFLSLVPVGSIGNASFRSLNELRIAALRGEMMNRDLPVSADLLDLRETQDLLSLNEQFAEQAVGRHRGWMATRHRQAVLGSDVVIHPSVRLEGPVIIHNRAVIDENSVVVGPTVIGVGCHVKRGATIVQSLLTAGTEVASNATIVHSVVAGRCSSSSPKSDAMLLRSVDGTRARMQHCDGSLTRTAKAGRWRQTAYPIAKRVMDVVVASIALLLLAPLFGLIAILIKRNSPGPVFFVHRRETRGGRDFPCLKFRTMQDGAHGLQREMYRNSEIDGPQFKIRRDPRLTTLGRWLRATNIDELPQLINVVAGHMSLVGPRPSPFRENQICVPWRRGRLSVPPGITGLWQLCRSESKDGDFNQWILYDLMYVRRRSTWLDIKIIVATVVTRGGAGHTPIGWLIPRSDRAGLA